MKPDESQKPPTLTQIEASVTAILSDYAFAPNNAATWAAVTSGVANFLTQIWAQGGLAGDKARDAFSVACGVGSTMSGADVLEGRMIVAVTVNLSSGQFEALTLTQAMRGPD